jgi:hypothetical protein
VRTSDVSLWTEVTVGETVRERGAEYTDPALELKAAGGETVQRKFIDSLVWQVGIVNLAKVTTVPSLVLQKIIDPHLDHVCSHPLSEEQCCLSGTPPIITPGVHQGDGW